MTMILTDNKDDIINSNTKLFCNGTTLRKHSYDSKKTKYFVRKLKQNVQRVDFLYFQ